jgi:autotransporter-associated beta strand protein
VYLAGDLVINGGTLQYTGPSNSPTSTTDIYAGRAFTIGALGATLDTTTPGATWEITRYNSGDQYPLVNNGGLLTLTGQGNGQIDKAIPAGPGGVDGGVLKSGSGTWTLTGNNSYTGGTTVSAGTLTLGNNLAMGAASGGLTANGGTLDLAGFSPSVGVLAGAAGTITSSATAGIATLTTSFGSVASTFSGVITGPVSLAKAGAGTLALNAANTYTGGTSIIGGRLVVGVTNALPVTTVVTLGGTSSGTLDLAGNNQTVAGLASSGLVANQVIGNSSASTTSTLTFAGGTNAASTFGGTIQDGLDGGGTMALAVTSGTLTLTGSNVYSGGTSVSGGLLEISSAGALPAGTSLTIGAAAGAVFDAGIGSGTGDAIVALSTGKASGTLNVPGIAAPGGYPASSSTPLSAPLAVSPAAGGSGVAAVPEPGTLALLAAGLAGTLLAGWRKRRDMR